MTDLAPYLPENFSDFVLTLNAVTLSRGTVLLFEDLSLTARSGDLLWIAGPNGSGKTSLLRVCAGLLLPDSGDLQITQNGRETASDRSIAYQPHRGFAKTGLSLEENFDLWRQIYEAPKSEILSAVGLKAAKDTRVEHLSAGQKRRLALAKLCTANRPVWLMDEPMAGLDETGRALVSDLVTAHLSRGGMALIASHNPANIPAKHTRRLTLEMS